MKLLLFPLKLLVVLMPWFIKRHLLSGFWRYELHPTSSIGLSWIFPETLKMAANARIGHLSTAIHLYRIEMDECSTIERGNWITGYPKGDASHFSHLPQRNPALTIGKHSSITKKHHLDCTASITIGQFTTIAGYQSQFLTHSIDIEANRQDANPIQIGDYCFVGTNVVILGGSRLPSHSVLGAKSLLNKSYEQTHTLYAGTPAKLQKTLPENYGYFHRKTGFVD